jgi:hypothetical protein
LDFVWSRTARASFFGMAGMGGFRRSEGIAAAYDDAAVHEAKNGHLWPFLHRRRTAAHTESGHPEVMW